MRTILALVCLSAAWHWPATARGEDERDIKPENIALHVDLLRAQLRLLELDAQLQTLDAIEDALVARATSQLALLQLSALPGYEPPRSRWRDVALGVAIGLAAGTIIGAGYVAIAR